MALVSLTSRSDIETAELFEHGHGSSYVNLACIVLQGNLGISKNNCTSLYKFVLNSGLKVFRHGLGQLSLASLRGC